MAVDNNTVSSIQLKPSNLFANGKMIVYDDGTGRLSRDQIEYVPQQPDEYYSVKIDDLITDIAYNFYKDKVDLPSHYWWVIADANKIKNPLDLSSYVGKEIIIPNIINFKLNQ